MKAGSSQTKFIRWTFRACLLLPIVYWFERAIKGELGAQPIVTLNRQTGYVLLSLILGNLWLGVFLRRKWLGPQWLRWVFAERRFLGIVAGLYVVLHFLCYLTREAFEKKAWLQIFEAFYLSMGFFAMVLILALAFTSNDWSVRKMGFPRWKLLHRMIHVASFFILAHIFLIEKGNLPLMALMTFPLIPFQAYRLYGARLRNHRKT